MSILTACSGGADVGERCDTVAECDDNLQCLNHTCVPRCSRHSDCGDGHLCRDDGVCELVASSIGDACEREVDCGPGQSCQLASEDFDSDGFLTASCQAENAGGVLDASCTVAPDEEDPIGAAAEADAECRTGTCVLGRCVDVCADVVEHLDCPVSHRCTSIPRELPHASGTSDVSGFHGCLPAHGTISYQVPLARSYARFFLPVPGLARSVAMISTIDDATQLVAAARITDPAGDLIHQLPTTRDEYFDNRLRSEPASGVLTLVMPQTPDDPMIPGAYVVELGSFRDLDGTPGTEVPQVELIYKLDDAVHLDVHFYFLNLDDHPCAAQLGGLEFDAAAARVSNGFQNQFLRELNLIFARAGVVLERADATYTDIRNRPDLDGLEASKLGELLALSGEEGGVSVFFVRTISPAGLQGLVGGPPAPPGRSGTTASGVAIGLDTLCYRDWRLVARTTAHEIARSLGLQRSVEPDGFLDSIADSPSSQDNLMYFSELGGTAMSADQREMLLISPVLE